MKGILAAVAQEEEVVVWKEGDAVACDVSAVRTPGGLRGRADRLASRGPHREVKHTPGTWESFFGVPTQVRQRGRSSTMGLLSALFVVCVVTHMGGEGKEVKFNFTVAKGTSLNMGLRGNTALQLGGKPIDLTSATVVFEDPKIKILAPNNVKGVRVTVDKKTGKMISLKLNGHNLRASLSYRGA